MGDIDVDISLETLEQLITSSKFESIIKKKNQLESLKKDMKYMRVFLKDTEKIRNNNSDVKNLVMQIKDVIFEVENIIELFVVQAFKANQAPDFLPQHEDHLSLDLERVKKKIKTLIAKVKQIYDENLYDISGVPIEKLKQSSPLSEGGSSSLRGSKTSNGAENVVIGFKEEVAILMRKLHIGGEERPNDGAEDQLSIISIIGAGGSGKTTLAREVYDHPLALRRFEIRAWVTVSQDYNKTKKRNLLIDILELASPKEHEDYENHSEDELGERVHKCLKGKIYLIVMDDIWDCEAWNDIQRSLPRERKGSRVLLTSRLLVEPKGMWNIPHHLDCLSESSSWALLQRKVFGNQHCPSELVDIGKRIAEKCGGLPLAIVTIAGILAPKDKTLDVWEEIAKHLSSIIAKGADIFEVLELSYNHLPLHLKACFVYIGGFLEDSEILVSELIWLLIAEGFIQQSDPNKSLEDIAIDYLFSLIDRNLIMVARKRSFGGIKTCRVHDVLREFCLKKAMEDKFLMQIYEDHPLFPSATMHRRLFIGSEFFHEFTSRPCTPNLRSFLCLRSQNSTHSSFEINLSFFVEKFELLRILSLISVQCQGKIGRGQLVHLRYLALQLPNDVSDFLSPFSCLFNLETLNIPARPKQFDWDTIPLPSDVLKMAKLRHLYAKRGVFEYHQSDAAAGIGSFKLDNLQTLCSICPCKKCQNFLAWTPNLRKLGFFGELISKDFVLMLPDLEFLTCLERLSVNHYGNPYGSSTLPPTLKLPYSLIRLTLKYTCLKWEALAILIQTLPSLEVLTLSTWACMGTIWDTSELDGFSKLKILRLQELEIKEWIASEDQFPRLEVLEVKYCKYLWQIPIDFANLNELRKIEVIRSSISAERSGREIQEVRVNERGDDGRIDLLFSYNYDY